MTNVHWLISKNRTMHNHDKNEINNGLETSDFLNKLGGFSTIFSQKQMDRVGQCTQS